MSEAAAGPGRATAVRWVYRLVLLGAFVLVWRLNAPGHMSVDSILALHEGRFQARETWNPAIFGWLLGLADRLVRGQALAMGVGAAVLFAAWAAMANLRTRVSWLGVAVALAIIALPQVLIYPGIVWKDVWFTEVAIAGFVLMALALKTPVPAAGWAFLGLSALAFAVAGLLRQNGLILAPAAALAMAWAGSGVGWRRSLFSAGLWLGTVAVATLVLSVVAQPQGMDKPDTAGGRGLRILQTYDLVGAAAQASLPFHHLDRHDPRLDDRLRADARGAYSPERVDTLNNTPIAEDLGKAPTEVIRAEWLDLVTQHTGVYLQVRAEGFRQVFRTPEIDRCLPLYVGADGPAKAMADLKMTRRWADGDRRLFNYATYFLDTPAYRHLTYAVIALVVGLLLLWRRDPADLAMASLMGGALVFSASFFVISIACDYRYLYLLDAAAITGALYLALDPNLTRPKARRRARG